MKASGMIHALFGNMDLCLVALVGSVWLNVALTVLLWLARQSSGY